MTTSVSTPRATSVRFRLLRADDAPATNPMGDAYVFGLQDQKGQLVAGIPRDDGYLAFDFELTAKIDPAGRLVFTGRFASGPVDDRFIYLSWRSVPRGIWINRAKARLSSIAVTIVRAMEAGDVLVADMSGWTPGDKRKHVDWRIERIGTTPKPDEALKTSRERRDAGKPYHSL